MVGAIAGGYSRREAGRPGSMRGKFRDRRRPSSSCATTPNPRHVAALGPRPARNRVVDLIFCLGMVSGHDFSDGGYQSAPAPCAELAGARHRQLPRFNAGRVLVIAACDKRIFEIENAE